MNYFYKYHLNKGCGTIKNRRLFLSVPSFFVCQVLKNRGRHFKSMSKISIFVSKTIAFSKKSITLLQI